MTAVVFLGPTLAIQEARAELDAVYLPPAAQGDVYRAALGRPRAIGIIDGYFERVPSVWHKEILWAMSQGTHVFGSASMGALRAAELAPFGMEGVGRVFEGFRNGLLEDDDEVTVVHGTAEVGYRPLSEAMVNIRRTLEDAETARVLAPEVRRVIEAIAKGLYYPERSYPALLANAAGRGVPAAALERLRAWLPHHRADQKREDALAMLRLMHWRLAAGLEPKRVAFVFEHTRYWDRLATEVGATRGAGDLPGEPRPEALLDELRLAGDAHGRAHRAATLRHLGLREAVHRGITPDEIVVTSVTEEFRRGRGFADPGDEERWLIEQGISRQRFEEMMRDEARLILVREAVEQQVQHRLLDHVRLSGVYGRLRERALAKEQALEHAGLTDPELGDTGLTADALLAWYFGRRGQPQPLDLERYAKDAGFADKGALLRALVREFSYVHLTGQGNTD